MALLDQRKEGASAFPFETLQHHQRRKELGQVNCIIPRATSAKAELDEFRRKL